MPGVHNRRFAAGKHHGSARQNRRPTLPAPDFQPVILLLFLACPESERTLTQLNNLTQTWLNQDYQRRNHEALPQTPYLNFTMDPNAGRRPAAPQTLRESFGPVVSRRVGTGTVAGWRGGRRVEAGNGNFRNEKP